MGTERGRVHTQPLALATLTTGVVLAAGRRLEIAVRLPLLKAAHKPFRIVRVDGWVLSRRLLAAAPTGITKNVHIGRPEGEACQADVVGTARFLTDCRANEVKERAVERITSGNPSRKRRRTPLVALCVESTASAGAVDLVGTMRYAMQRLGPDVVKRQAQALHGRHLVAEETTDLRDRDARDEIGHTRIERRARVAGKCVLERRLAAWLRHRIHRLRQKEGKEPWRLVWFCGVAGWGGMVG